MTFTEQDIRKWTKVADIWLARRARNMIGGHEEALVATKLGVSATQLRTVDRVQLGIVIAEVTRILQSPFVERAVTPRRR